MLAVSHDLIGALPETNGSARSKLTVLDADQSGAAVPRCTRARLSRSLGAAVELVRHAILVPIRERATPSVAVWEDAGRDVSTPVASIRHPISVPVAGWAPGPLVRGPVALGHAGTMIPCVVEAVLVFVPIGTTRTYRVGVFVHGGEGTLIPQVHHRVAVQV
jgi:hypothetical protein